MQGADWSNPDATRGHCVERGRRGALLVNAWWEPLTFRLPGDVAWTVELDTSDPTAGRRSSGSLELAGRSLVLLSAQR